MCVQWSNSYIAVVCVYCNSITLLIVVVLYTGRKGRHQASSKPVALHICSG